jgi:hypothetical protein
LWRNSHDSLILIDVRWRGHRPGAETPPSGRRRRPIGQQGPIGDGSERRLQVGPDREMMVDLARVLRERERRRDLRSEIYGLIT